MKGISGSVGYKGENNRSDTELIQQLLNKNFKSDPNAYALKIDGYCGPKTIDSIRKFQRQRLQIIHPDGRVDPTGNTFKKLSSPLPHQAQAPEHVTLFLSQFSEIAKTISRKWDVPASVLLAQAAHESGWGKHVKGNAYFGIKGKSPQGNSVTFATTEVENQKKIAIKDTFRAYQNFEEAADDYGRFLNQNPRYKTCFSNKNYPYQFVNELAKAGYATDPEYAKKVSNIIRKYELTKYDH